MKHTLAAAAALLLLVPLHAAAQADEGETKEVRLEARGGATFDVPDWKQTRSDDAVAVLERAPDREGDVPFVVLVLAIEEGPEETDDLDWERIRDNVVEASEEAGSDLALEVGDAFDAAEGFAGRKLTGTLTAGEREVSVALVALVAEGVLITVSAIGPKDGEGTSALAEEVAATTRRSADR